MSFNNFNKYVKNGLQKKSKVYLNNFDSSQKTNQLKKRQNCSGHKF